MKKTLIILSLSVVILSSCNKQSYQKIVKSNDNDLKYQKATELFNEGKYSKALQLYEQLVPRERGRTRGEEVYFKYAVCNFEINDYILAGFHFREFSNTYPNSQFAEEALFRSAYCYYLEAPVWSLDQEITNGAIGEFELFISRFPESTKIDSCNTIIDELRENLETKSYKNAVLYYDIGYLRAAYIALENSLEDFPYSKNREEILYYSFKANTEFAQKSIKAKQEERFAEALERYNNYTREFTNGKYIKDVEKLNKSITEQSSIKKTKADNKKIKKTKTDKNNK